MAKSALGLVTQEDISYRWKVVKKRKFRGVNALGESRVLVNNINGELKLSDYITTSAIVGGVSGQ